MQYVDADVLKTTANIIAEMLSRLLANNYVGPLGVDMMLVNVEGESSLKVHPCVELNLRRTMGHVALALSPLETEPQQLMNIDYSKGTYHLRLHTLADGLLKTSIARL